MVHLTMRVGLIAKRGSSKTGLGRYSDALKRGLEACGHETISVSPSVPVPRLLRTRLTRLASLDIEAFLNNYPIVPRYPDADLYHFTSQNLATQLRLRRPPGPVVVTVHDILPFMLRDDASLCTYRTLADRWMDRIAMAGLRRADLLVASSEFTKVCIERYLGIPSERIHVVHLGVDLDFYKPCPASAADLARFGLKGDARHLLYVGTDDPRKDLATLLRAFRRIRETREDVHLVKVGSPAPVEQRERSLELAADLGVLPYVHFLDDVDEATLRLIYSAADVYVQPSLYEGFGLPVLEAMACGTPVVASSVGPLPEVIGDTGYLASPGDEGSLAEGITRLLDDPGLRLKQGRRALERARSYSWDRTVAGTTQLYSMLIRSSRAA